jgi:hypothetical protein
MTAAEFLVSVALLLLLGGFLLLIVWMSVVTVIDALRGKRPEDMRREGWGRDHDRDWP